jgi:RNase H-fold protein (predicted Holliday junction resolvase)
LDTLVGLRREFPEVRFVEWDERLTTRVAAASGGGKKRKRVRVDHLAAAGMLQEYLARTGNL